MKPILFSLPLFLTFFIGFAQTHKQVKGKVHSSEKPLQNIDVVNMTTKAVTATNHLGDFSILASEGEELYFISKDYIDRKITISKKDFQTDLIVELTVKPIELEEVKVENSHAVKFKASQREINAGDQTRLQMEASRPVVQGVYTGQTVNGADFIRLAKDVIRLLKKKDSDKQKPKPVVVFKDFVQSNYEDSFYTKTLKLRADQVVAFIDYCNDDPKASQVVQNNNELEVMDFLIAKANEFKKL